MIKTDSRKDIIRRADGVNDGSVVNPGGFKATTDKMGITTAGAISKGYIWGIVTVIVVLAVGMATKKVNLHFVK